MLHILDALTVFKDCYILNAWISGKRKKRGKSGRVSRNKSKQGKDGRVSKQCTPVATKVKPSVIQNDVQDISNGVAGMGVLQNMCKPMVLHKTPERKHSEKHETKTISIVNRQTTQVSTKQIILPQMTNNFMVKTDVKERTSGQDPLQSSKSFVYPPSRVNHTDISKITKIYLSEKQSGVVRDCGMDVPCAPPATPLPGESPLSLSSKTPINIDLSLYRYLQCLYILCIIFFLKYGVTDNWFSYHWTFWQTVLIMKDVFI